jgi:hypothetical protein
MMKELPTSMMILMEVTHAGEEFYPDTHHLAKFNPDEIAIMGDTGLARVDDRIYNIADSVLGEAIVPEGAQALFTADGCVLVIVSNGNFHPVKPTSTLPSFNEILLIRNSLIVTKDGRLFKISTTPTKPISKLGDGYVMVGKLIYKAEGNAYSSFVEYKAKIEDLNASFKVVDAITQEFNPKYTIILDNQARIWVEFANEWE